MQINAIRIIPYLSSSRYFTTAFDGGITNVYFPQWLSAGGFRRGDDKKPRCVGSEKGNAGRVLLLRRLVCMGQTEKKITTDKTIIKNGGL